MAETDELPVLEHGRYRLWQTPDGGWLLARAAFTCDRCQSCGCGEQQDHVTVPGMMVRIAEAMQSEGGEVSALGMIKRMIRRKRLDDYIMGGGKYGTDGRDDHEGGGGGAEAAEGSDPAGGDLAAVSAARSPDQEGGSVSGDGGSGDPGQV